MATHLSVSVVVPITAVSLLTDQAIAIARELAPRPLAVRVLLPQEHELGLALKASRSARYPDVPLALFETEYQSIARPIKVFVRSRLEEVDRVIVLIPVLEPHELRHRLLHNQLNLVLGSSFAHEERVVVARVVVPVDDLHTDAPAAPTQSATVPFDPLPPSS